MARLLLGHRGDLSHILQRKHLLSQISVRVIGATTYGRGFSHAIHPRISAFHDVVILLELHNFRFQPSSSVLSILLLAY